MTRKDTEMNTIKEIMFAVPAGVVTSTFGQTNKCTHIKCSLYYSKGGYVGISNSVQRGYYISVCPVKLDGMLITSYAFSGAKKLIVPCERRSKGKEAEAVAIFDRDIVDLVKRVFPNAGINGDEHIAA